MKPGETFAHGKYTLLRKLRSSGMAEVWLARQHGTEGFAKDVVIKRILPHLAEDDKLVTMFLDEARIAANLNHANVVHIFDLGNDGENYFIAMEYIRGYDIEQICEQLKSRNTSFPIEYAVRIIADTCLGLGYAHDCTTGDGTPMGVVHRDVSPQNILVSHTGVVKLIDFGIAKARTSSSRTQVGHTKGKICYMSPEQMMARELDRRSDLFSTAVVLYEMLCATKPFDGDNLLACFHKLMKEGIPSPRELRYDIPPRLEAILMKGLAKDREERYPTAAAFRYEMEGFLREMGISVGPEHLSDFLKWLFTPPESTQVVLDVPRVMPMHATPMAYPPPAAPMLSTQDRISAVPRPVTKPNLPTGHNLTPSRTNTGSGFGMGAAEVTVMDDLARQEPHFGFEPTDINTSLAHNPSFLPNYSSPQIPSMGSPQHHTGPELGLPMELEDEENPYARRRRDDRGGGGLWIWALFGFVLLTGSAVAAHFMGWLPGSPSTKDNPPSPPPTIRAIAAPPADAGPNLPTPPPKKTPDPVRPNESRIPPRTTPPVVERRTEPVRRTPAARPTKRPKPRTVARNGCPRGGRGKLILDTPEKGQAYSAADPTDSFEVPNLSEAKDFSAGKHTIVFIWGNNKRWKTTVCVYRNKTTPYTCEFNRYCRINRE